MYVYNYNLSLKILQKFKISFRKNSTLKSVFVVEPREFEFEMVYRAFHYSAISKDFALLRFRFCYSLPTQ